MLFSSVLEKYRKQRSQRLVIRELILTLNIDQSQRDLFLESLDILDQKGIESFYERLMQFVETIEKKDLTATFGSTSTRFSSMRDCEVKEKQKEVGSFNILFDNI